MRLLKFFFRLSSFRLSRRRPSLLPSACLCPDRAPESLLLRGGGSLLHYNSCPSPVPRRLSRRLPVCPQPHLHRRPAIDNGIALQRAIVIHFGGFDRLGYFRRRAERAWIANCLPGGVVVVAINGGVVCDDSGHNDDRMQSALSYCGNA